MRGVTAEGSDGCEGSEGSLHQRDTELPHGHVTHMSQRGPGRSDSARLQDRVVKVDKNNMKNYGVKSLFFSSFKIFFFKNTEFSGNQF